MTVKEHLKILNAKKRTHGEHSHIPEYQSWCGMIQRCTNPKRNSYVNYGGRGIKVCAHWRKSYVAFLTDMGRKPTKEHSLDRIDNDGDYTPENCRWGTKKQQSQNRRMPRLKPNSNKKTLYMREWRKRRRTLGNYLS